jgi:hypothetical protein
MGLVSQIIRQREIAWSSINHAILSAPNKFSPVCGTCEQHRSPPCLLPTSDCLGQCVRGEGEVGEGGTHKVTLHFIYLGNNMGTTIVFWSSDSTKHCCGAVNISFTSDSAEP